MTVTRMTADHQFTVQYPLVKEPDFGRPRRRHPSTPPVSPDHHVDRSSRRLSSPRLHAQNSAPSLYYTNMLVCDAPCPSPTPLASMYSPVSPTTEPATIQLGSVILGSGVEAAAAAAEASFNLKAPEVAGAKAAAVRHAALAAAVAIEGVRGAADELRSPASVACVLRRQLQQDRLTLSPRAQREALTLGVRLERMQARDRGLSFTDILRTIAPSSYIDNLRKVWQRRSHYKSLDAASQRVSLENGRGSHFGSIDKRM